LARCGTRTERLQHRVRSSACFERVGFQPLYIHIREWFWYTKSWRAKYLATAAPVMRVSLVAQDLCILERQPVFTRIFNSQLRSPYLPLLSNTRTTNDAWCELAHPSLVLYQVANFASYSCICVCVCVCVCVCCFFVPVSAYGAVDQTYFYEMSVEGFCELILDFGRDACVSGQLWCHFKRTEAFLKCRGSCVPAHSAVPQTSSRVGSTSCVQYPSDERFFV